MQFSAISVILPRVAKSLVLVAKSLSDVATQVAKSLAIWSLFCGQIAGDVATNVKRCGHPVAKSLQIASDSAMWPSCQIA